MKRDSHQSTAVIYARVSSKEQEEGYSIDAQLRLLRDYAKINGFIVVREFVEVETAKRSGRKQFTEMLAFLKDASKAKDPRKACRTVLVEKTDRLYRNFHDYVALDETDLDLHFVKDNQVLSKDSRSQEKFVHGIKVLMAKNYVDNLSEEASKGMQEKARQGFYPSHAPVGYKNVRTGEKSVLEIDPYAAPFIQRIYSLYASGNYSLKRISKLIAEEGYRSKGTGAKVSTSQVHQILRNPIYHGKFLWKGELFEGNHPPIVSTEQFEAVRALLEKNGRNATRKKKYEWAFTGLIECGNCGAAMTAEKKKGKYVYYHCSHSKQRCNEKYVREEDLDRMFRDALKAIYIDSETLAWVQEILKISHKDKAAYHDSAVKALNLRAAKVQAQIDRLLDCLLDGTIEKETFQVRHDQLREEKEKITARLKSHEQADTAYVEQASKLLELAQTCVNSYESQPLLEKRKLLNFVISNSTLKNGELKTTFKKPFDLLALTVQKDREEQKKFQPDERFSHRAEKWLGR